MASWKNLLGRFFAAAVPLTAPFFALCYRSKFTRKMVVRISLFVLITPFIGHFRRSYIIRQYKDQIEAQNTVKETQIKQTLVEAQLDFTSSDNNFDYMVLVKSQRNYEDEELFEKQKALFNLNNEVLSKNSQNENYFDGIKFMFVGNDRIYEGLKNNLPQEGDNQFSFINKEMKKGGMSIPKPDNILLICKDQNGDNKIIMEWPFDANINLKAIIRQISKHKHRKYVQSMDF